MVLTWPVEWRWITETLTDVEAKRPRESSTGYEVIFDLAGAIKETIDIRPEDGYLKVTATAKYGKQELTLHRVAYLPDNVDVTKATASYDNGLLVINLPKMLTNKSSKIPVLDK